MFGSLGGSEVFLILVIALIVFGPRKLPEIGKSVGKMLGEFRKASSDFKQTIENEVEAEKLRDLAADTHRIETAPAVAEPDPVSEPSAEAPAETVSRESTPPQAPPPQAKDPQ